MISVKILGTGCRKCQNLEDKVKELITNKNINAEIEKVTDLSKMIDYGIMMTPGLVINDVVKSMGILPKDEQIINWLEEANK